MTTTATEPTPAPAKKAAKAAKTSRPRKTAPAAQSPAPAPADASGVAANADAAAYTAPAPRSPAADVGAVVSYLTDVEDENTLTRGIVVGTVEGAEHRDEGLLVVPLPDAFYVPLDAVKD